MAKTNGTNGNGKTGGNGQKALPPDVLPPGHDREGAIPDLDAAIRKAFFATLADSGNVTLACRVVGIHRSTYYRWKAQGEKDRAGKFYSFAQTVTRGLAEWERRQIAIIDKAAEDYTAEEDWAEQWTKGEGAQAETRSKVVKKRHKKKGDWRAAAWRLERRFPKRYGEKREVEVKGRLDLVDVLTQLRDEAEEELTRTGKTPIPCPTGQDRATTGEG